MTDPIHPQRERDPDDVFTVGDDHVDWSRVDELPAAMAEVVDTDTALAFYDRLAGH